MVLAYKLFILFSTCGVTIFPKTKEYTNVWSDQRGQIIIVRILLKYTEELTEKLELQNTCDGI